MSKTHIPTRADWGDLKDLDVAYAYKAYGGKTVEEALPLFLQDPIGRSGELLFAPAPIFNYYIHGFVLYLTSEESQNNSDAASCFLRLIITRLNEPGASEVVRTVQQIKPDIDKVAGRQSFYDADADIYGSFEEIKSEIEHALSRFKVNE